MKDGADLKVILDASMTAAWLFADEQTEASMALLDEVAADGAVVPSLWHLEVANLLRTAERRGRCERTLAHAMIAELDILPIEVDQQTHVNAWHATRDLSIGYGLTPYDAAYLELALRLGLPLATGDRELVRAADDAGVEVRTP